MTRHALAPRVISSPATATWATLDGIGDERVPATSFGQVVRQIRIAKGLSQQEVANRAGFSPGYVGLIESGDRGGRPKLDTVKRVGQGLNATVAETEALMRATGYLRDDEPLIDDSRPTLLGAIAADPRLTVEQKAAFVVFYRACVPDS